MEEHSNTDANFKKKVEEIGIYFEKLGFTPMAGRVLGFLLITDPPYSSFQDIQEFLSASKSSISNAINWLMNDGRIDYQTFSGDRKRYFKVNPRKWENMLKERISNWSSSSKLLESILEIHTGSQHEEFIGGLQRIIEIESFLQKKMIQAVKDWDQYSINKIINN